jgi:hypothetical protein
VSLSYEDLQSNKGGSIIYKLDIHTVFQGSSGTF